MKENDLVRLAGARTGIYGRVLMFGRDEAEEPSFRWVSWKRSRK